MIWPGIGRWAGLLRRNANGSAAIAKVAAEMPKEAPQSPRLRRKCQRRRRSRQGCGGNAKGGGAVAKVFPQMPDEAQQSQMLGLKCQMRSSNRKMLGLKRQM